ncbi:hypothetical protein QFZ33_001092 [Arthrobacter globiformis]|nr:hypothetical protein [Arthrobacter globiformis]
MPSAGAWTEVLNTDSEDYGGSGVLNGGTLTAEDEGIDGQPATLTVTLPPLAAAYFKPAEPSVITSAAAARAKVTEADSIFAGPTAAGTRDAETRAAGTRSAETGVVEPKGAEQKSAEPKGAELKGGTGKAALPGGPLA